jgi:hypothetical protein
LRLSVLTHIIARLIMEPDLCAASSTGAHPTHNGQEKSSQPFTKVGMGTFAAIFADPTEPFVFKRAFSTMRKDAFWRIGKEYAVQQKISAAFDVWSSQDDRDSSMAGLQIQIPRPQRLIISDSTWWSSNASRFPADDPQYPLASPLLMTERIFSIPESLQQQVLQQRATGDLPLTPSKQGGTCLLHLYLGSQQQSSGSDLHRPKRCPMCVRNLSCSLEEISALELDAKFLSAQLGKALAVLHFEACTDGRGVEFVLGRSRVAPDSPPPAEERPPDLFNPSLQGSHGALSIWCLDFDKCQRLTFTSESSIRTSIDRCVLAYFQNDPYYPRPDQVELWNIFGASYRSMAENILLKQLDAGGSQSGALMMLWTSQRLPSMFLEAVGQLFWESTRDSRVWKGVNPDSQSGLRRRHPRWGSVSGSSRWGSITELSRAGSTSTDTYPGGSLTLVDEDPAVVDDQRPLGKTAVTEDLLPDKPQRSPIYHWVMEWILFFILLVPCLAWEANLVKSLAVKLGLKQFLRKGASSLWKGVKKRYNSLEPDGGNSETIIKNEGAVPLTEGRIIHIKIETTTADRHKDTIDMN